MKKDYIEMILSIERLHRRFLDVIKSELDRLKIDDINNIQTLILYNINDEEITVGELTNRGYYLGSNVSYNVKKLVENKYLIQERAPHDKRSIKIRLSTKGLELCKIVDDLYQKQADSLENGGINDAEISNLNSAMLKLEKFWSLQLNHLFRE